MEGTPLVREIVDRMLPHVDYLSALQRERGTSLVVTLYAIVPQGFNAATPSIQLDNELLTDIAGLGGEFATDFSLRPP